MVFLSEKDFVSKNKTEVANTLLRLAQFKAGCEICKKNLFKVSYKNTVNDPILSYIHDDVFSVKSKSNDDALLQITLIANLLYPYDLNSGTVQTNYDIVYDYYIRNFVSQYNSLDLVKEILYPIMTARVDIKNKGNKNSIEVVKCSDKDSKVYFPKWCIDNTGNGLVFESNSANVELVIKCIKDGRLFFNFKSVDFKNRDKNRINIFIDYENIKIIDAENNLKYSYEDKIEVSHDKGKALSFDVKDGEIFTISFSAFIPSLSKERINEIMNAVFYNENTIDVLNV